MKNISQKTQKMAQLAILSAIIILMAFTPLGYMQIGPMKMTFLMIPVTLGALILGPSAGAFLGTVFGLTSFAQGFGLDYFGTTLMGIQPVYYAIMCIIPRTLMGYLTGLIFAGLSKADRTKNKILSISVSGLCGPLLNTILFMSALILLFGQTDFIKGFQGTKNILLFVVSFVGVQGLLEIILTMVVVILLSQVILMLRNRALQKE